MTSLSTLGNRFRKMVRDLDVPDYFKTFHTTPQHDGSPHVETEGGTFYFVVTERGSEIERVRCSSADEVLYLLLRSITQYVATQYECEKRQEGIDGRTIWFPYQEKLMADLRPEWGERLKKEHRDTLARYPFRSHGDGT